MVYCRLTPNEKLPDRFLFSGILKTPNGSLYIAYVIEITKPWFPSSRVAPVIVNELKSNLSRISGATDLLAAFEETLKDVNESLFELSEQGETEWIGNLNSLIILIAGRQIHLSQSGSLPGYLFRKQKINQITEGLTLERDVHPLKTFSSIISGNLEENDRLLIANHELFNVLSLDMLRQIVIANSPYQASLTIRKALKKHHIPTVSSLIFNFIDKKSEELEPDVVIVEEGFERWHKKFWRAIKPKLADGWQLTKHGASNVHKTYKQEVLPRLKRTAKKGLEISKTSSQTAIKFSQEKIIPKIQAQTGKIFNKKPNLEKIKEEIKNTEDLKLDPTQSLEKLNETVKPQAPKINRFKPLRLLKIKSLKKQYWYIAIALVLILVVIGAISLRRDNRKLTAKQSQNQTNTLKQIQNLIVEAETLKATNNNDQAIEKFVSARSQLKKIKDKNEKSSLESQINNNLNELTKNKAIEPLDNRLKFSDETIDQLELIAPYYFASSSKNGKIYRQAFGSLDTAKEQLISPPTTIARGITDLYAENNNNQINLMIVSGDGQIFKLEQTSTESKMTEMKNPIGKFAAADTAEGYLGNLYLLDSSTGLLWKYPLSGSNFDKGVNQVDINTVDLKKSTSMTIDGYIYVLKEDGSAVKLLKGIPEEGFALKPPPKPDDRISKPIKIIASPKESNLYIIDGGISNRKPARILEYDKAGNFIRQFSLPESLDNVKDGLIKITEKKVWILSGQTIYEFNLP